MDEAERDRRLAELRRRYLLLPVAARVIVAAQIAALTAGDDPLDSQEIP